MGHHNFRTFIPALLWVAFLPACGVQKIIEFNQSSVNPMSAYCTPSETFSVPTVTITGTAEYEYRANGNGAVAGPNPVRYAEVEVRNAAGSVVQCAETTNTGTFSFVVPQNTGNYVVYVNSRANNSNYRAYVMNNPTSNSAYSLAASFSSAANTSVGTLTAAATGDVKGGAFNILDKILDANVYLRDNTEVADGCGTTYTDCTPFTTAPVVYAYWTKGFDPGTGYGVSSGAVSYYRPGLRELYILGGVSGNVDSSDTDHFDNSIILHEYGHFIEDVYSVSDSPGGSHSTGIIDPRLAWSEGWANFFQAAILNDPLYRDTVGNTSGSTYAIFNQNLETGTLDLPTTAGEGNFREFAITRALWDGLDSANEGAPNAETAQSPFAVFWSTFAGTTDGFKASSQHFRNIGLFHKIQQVVEGADPWSTLRTNPQQRQTGDLSDYATPLINGACNFNMTPTTATSAGTTFSSSNLFSDNDFYHINHAGGALTIVLSYTTVDNSPNAQTDLDLFLWKSDYVYGSSSSIAAVSEADHPNGSLGPVTETISTSLAAGQYMLNVKAYTAPRQGGKTGPGGATTYTLTINGSQKCANP